MYTGPNTVNDGLLFGYDTGYGVADNRTATRFYPGEPTTNLLPSPGTNGRFTTSNGWGTYNTNQYNGNNYFDIGVISGISNNIVTLSSVGRTIRSFDVLTPQTTGGGVTAGTRYVIKKISSTTFSLHAYNSSQNGSQGYTNPDTGFFKVHDAYANDTRVSISASGFPDMWWGPPHSPNSGLIKEIVPNGGYVKGTNCMRFHIYRGDGVADGMAYSVYTPVTVGDVITVSYWARPVGTLGYGKYLGYSTYFSGNPAPGFGTNLNSDGEWQLITHTWTASATVNFYSYFWPQGSTDKYAMDIADMQVEVNGGHATPFTLTSRSNTASLIDLKGTTDIDISSISFDSTGQPTFDGTDDYIDVATNFGTLAQYSFEWVENPNATHKMPISTRQNVAFYKYGAYSWRYTHGGTAGELYHTTGATSGWHHWAVTYDGSTLKIFQDNIILGTRSVTGTADFSQGLKIGWWSSGGDYAFDGDIPVMKFYNKALTADEVARNFNAYKNRFNI